MARLHARVLGSQALSVSPTVVLVLFPPLLFNSVHVGHPDHHHHLAPRALRAQLPHHVPVRDSNTESGVGRAGRAALGRRGGAEGSVERAETGTEAGAKQLRGAARRACGGRAQKVPQRTRRTQDAAGHPHHPRPTPRTGQVVLSSASHPLTYRSRAHTPPPGAQPTSVCARTDPSGEASPQPPAPPPGSDAP
eukprot:scaffold428_cov105-Isochrysis_galbana.AAC.1